MFHLEAHTQHSKSYKITDFSMFLQGSYLTSAKQWVVEIPPSLYDSHAHIAPQTLLSTFSSGYDEIWG